MNNNQSLLRKIAKRIPRISFAIKRMRIKISSKKTFKQAEKIINKKYYDVFSKNIDWDNPKTYNEKICVAKLYTSSPLKTMLSDKMKAGEWAKKRIKDNSLKVIPTLETHRTIKDIDFDALPESYVIKMNNDSGSAYIVDKNHPITKELIMSYKLYFEKRNFAYKEYEMQYKGIEPVIMIEQYMGKSIRDYKFQCFNGKVSSCRVDFDRFGNHTRNFYDKNWKLLPYNKGGFNNKKGIKKPKCYEKMWKIAEILSNGLDQVRVDLYCINDTIYFGEMTFTNGGGLEPFMPAIKDYEFGAMWNLDTEEIQKRRRILLNKKVSVDYSKKD